MDIVPLDQIQDSDAAQVGNKATSLATMLRAGLPVPSGFCIKASAFGSVPSSFSADLASRVVDAYQQLGGGRVAVRSSAIAEDSDGTSFAGQHDSFLDVQGGDEVLNAITRCLKSLRSARAIAYRQEHRAGAGHEPGAAVVVQNFVGCQVTGVLFTSDPLHPDQHRVVIEACNGPQDGVESGEVTPDRYVLHPTTGHLIERRLATATGQLDTADVQASAEKEKGCLDDRQLAELGGLGRQVEALFNRPCDIEWGLADGRFWLFQARPITATAAEREQLRRDEIASLAAAAAPGGTVWTRFNLSETLPEPTPMTWAIVNRFLSAKGGLGGMYRDLGFRPSPALNERCAYDLICGRTYCNLSREPQMYAGAMPWIHDFATLKMSPQRALNPQPQLDLAQAGWSFWLLLPVHTGNTFLAALRMRSTREAFADYFSRELAPSFERKVARESELDLGSLTAKQLWERLNYRIERTLSDFARDALKPAALAASLISEMERVLRTEFGAEQARTWVKQLLAQASLPAQTDLAQAIRRLASGQLSRADFLHQFGHRAFNEMELAQPRWRECPESVDAILETIPRQHGSDAGNRPTTAELTDLSSQRSPALLARLDQTVAELRTYVLLRETAKNQLMKGYALIHDALVEIDRRHRLDGGVFYLTLSELPQLIAGEDLSNTIKDRRRRRRIALSIDVPPVLFSDDLEAIGRPRSIPHTAAFQGTPLSPGVAEGQVLLVTSPSEVSALPPDHILVCPSADPSWTPLFLQARGLIMEVGGLLSHAAIVAREFGVPAVAGIAGIHRLLRAGQRVRIDGTTGRVVLLENPAS
jgi:pyruvate,water dikinase